ncbi:hypothetical protein CPC08DRAFT_756999 [Agrocybe pediades]|nr:hypothetical protein CPC08DRAFT_756999 [Agrocybe pediades]
MNKNPFLPTPSYTPHQPPLPPGPPPAQPGQPDYSAWWANAGQPHAQQPPTVGPYNPQWTAPQPQPQAPPRPPAEQSALYANYGYGTQNHWQRQQQQPPPQPQQYHPPPPIVPQPPPQSQPGYNPYQPTAGYPQQYVPQPGPPAQPMVPSYPHAGPQQPQQMFVPHMPPHQPQQHQPQQQPTQPRHHHTSPQHLPPAKRQRFDGPNANNRHGQGQQHHQQPPPPQFQPPPPPPQNNLQQGPNRGMIPSGPGGRGGVPSGPGGRGGNANRGSRGGSMVGNRGGLGGNRGRGGSFVGSGGRGGAGGQSSGPLRGHNSRNFGPNKDFHGRRGGMNNSFNSGGGGNYSQGSSSFRGRNQGPTGPARNRNDGGSGAAFGPRENTSSSFGKKDENRRTLTDFKIVGLAITDLDWEWGSIPSSPVKSEALDENTESLGSVPSAVKEEATEDGVPAVTSSNNVEEGHTEVKVDDSGQSSQPRDAEMVDAKSSEEEIRTRVSSDATQIPPSRIRIYFHTPVTADDARPIPHNTAYADVPADTRKGKRKKLEDDDGDMEERRAPPPPPQMASGVADDRSSVPASVAPSVAETASEADWLMAAIVEGEEEAEAAGELDPAEEDGDATQIVKDEHDIHVDGNDGDAREDDEALLGGKQTHIARDVALSVKDSPRLYLTRGGLSPCAHTADAVSFIQGHSHNDVDHDHDHDMDAAKDAEGGVHEPTVPAISVEFPIAQSGAEPQHQSDASGQSHDQVEGGNVSSEAAETHAPAPASELATNELAQLSVSEVPEASFVADDIQSHDDAHVPEFAADHPADPPEYPEMQIYPQSSQPYPPKSLEAVSAESTLLDVGSEQATQLNESQPPPSEHLSEPAMPVVSHSEATHQDEASTSAVTSQKSDKTPSANRLSISYSRGNRRLVIDAEVVESLKVFRAEGRIEIAVKLEKDKNDKLKGILMEGLSDVTKSYLPLLESDLAATDPTVPSFGKTGLPATILLTVYLDTARPLSEPKWVKTGDIQEWLKSIFGRMFWVAGDAAEEGWEKKIHVVDPDPPPTIWTVLEGWVTNSPVGALNERQRFLKTHLTDIDNILEILLRLVRGERATAFSQSSPAISAPSVSGPLLSALGQGSAHSGQQTHVSLAVLAIFRLAEEFAIKALGDKGKTEVEERVGEIIRCLPSHLVYKSLDGIFKEWRVEKKGR